MILLFVVGISLLYVGNIAIKETISYKDRIIAKFTAESGISFAISERVENAKRNLYDSEKGEWYFKREEYIDNNLNGFYDGQDTFIYNSDQNGNGIYDTYISSEESLYPSYKADMGGVLIYLPTGEVIIQPASGFLPSQQVGWLQFYKLKILDNASGILINYPTKNADKSSELADSVVNLLNNLGEVVVIPQAGKKINALHPLKLGERIREMRKLGPIKFKEELTYEKYGTLRFSKEEFFAIKDFISVSMWRDPRTYEISSFPKYIPEQIEEVKKEVLVPFRRAGQKFALLPEFEKNDISIFHSFYKICPGFLIGRGVEEQENLARFSDHLNNNYGAEDQSRPRRNNIVVPPEIEFEMRAPININTAPKEVLIAMFLNLQAKYFDKNEKTYVNPGKLKLSEPISLRKATLLAYHIISYRRKNIIRNFQDFKNLILGYKSIGDFDLTVLNKDFLDASFSFLSDVDKKVILANADPESHIYEFNPDRTIGAIFENISKSYLTFNTTEITFFSHGYYEIESSGFVVREFDESEKEKKQKELERQFRIGMIKLPKESHKYFRPSVFKEKHYSDKFHKLLAIEKVVSNVSLYETVKLSSQADFVYGFPVFQGDSLVSVEIPEEKVRIEGVELYPENLNSLERRLAAKYDGYISLKPKTIPIWKEMDDRLVFRADLVKDFKPQKGATRNAMGTAYDGRSLLDLLDAKMTVTMDDGSVYSIDYTKNSLLPDGFFIHEAKRVNYRYCNDNEGRQEGRQIENACKYGYTTGSNLDFESYIFYRSYYKDKWNFPKKGYLEMWFKPAWNVEDQELSWEGSDTRTFFSMGDSRGFITNNQTVEIKETRQVGLLDPEEVAQTIAATVPNVNRVVVEVPPAINNIIALIRQRFARGGLQSLIIPDVKYTIRYTVTVASQAQVAPLERFAFFARNRELALFVGNNFDTTNSIDTFGNLRKTSVPLPESWKAGTWHHLAFKWYGPKKTVRVFLDGKPSVNAYKPDFVLNNLNSMFFGSNRFRFNKCNGFPLNADGTIASIRIYDYPNIVSSAGFAVPDRYDPSASIRRKNAYFESLLFPKSTTRRFANHKLFGIILNGTIDESLNVDLENQYGGFCIDLMIGEFTYENVACFGKFFKNPQPQVLLKVEKETVNFTPPGYSTFTPEPLNLSYSRGWVSTNYLNLKETGTNEIKYRVKFEAPFVFPLLTTPVLDSIIFLFLRNPIISSQTSTLPGKF
ncbi:MAG: hypothetical protein ACK4NF_02500 [Planctomycetota bacterium]